MVNDWAERVHSTLTTLVLLGFGVGALGVGTLCRAAAAPDYAHARFTFGPGAATPGNVQVLPGARYDAKTGYGFDFGTKVEAIERSIGDGHGGFCTNKEPFFFSVRLPEGNYKVTVTLGDPQGQSMTTVKAELRRLMLEHVATKAGELVYRSFIVNIRIPAIATGGQVRLNVPRELVDEAVAWDDKLTLEFSDARPCLDSLEIEKVAVPTVFILGDSTVCDQSKEPYASWGQMLPRFFKPEIAVANHAESGASVASADHARRFDKVLSLIKPGDYLLIQFGHNDMKSKDPHAPDQYKAALKQWVQEVKKKGAQAVLITPVNRHSFVGDKIVNSFREYPQMVHALAAEEGVPLIDLNAMSKTLYEALGPQRSIQLFKHDADLHSFDGTHHCAYGAYELAKCVIEGIRQAKLDLAKYIGDDVGVFDPAKPDPVADFKVPPSPGATALRPLGD